MLDGSGDVGLALVAQQKEDQLGGLVPLHPKHDSALSYVARRVILRFFIIFVVGLVTSIQLRAL